MEGVIKMMGKLIKMMGKLIKSPKYIHDFQTSPDVTKTQPKSNYLWIFDNGHGGIIKGKYQTAGKRSPVWDDGSQLFEGEFNRAIVNRLVKMCDEEGIECVNLVDTQEDISLSKRTDKANDIAKNTPKDCVYVSIHANGFDRESANGWSVYTSKGQTKSDIVAEVLEKEAKLEFPTETMRGTKESDFWVLRKTVMPAILSENFFMTNSDNCHDYLLSESGRDRITKIHFEMIKDIESQNTI